MKCRVCGCEFDYEEAKEEYEEHYNHELEYDWDYPHHDRCFECACCESNSNMAEGYDILMMKRGGLYDPNDDD